MSWVADVLLSVDTFEDAAVVEAFTAWLESQAPRREPPDARGVGFLLPLDRHPETWGGWKRSESHLWGGAMNHARVPEIVQRFAEMPWTRPQVAQLLIRDQEQDAFRLWMIRDGRAQQFAPLPEYGEDE